MKSSSYFIALIIIWGLIIFVKYTIRSDPRDATIQTNEPKRSDVFQMRILTEFILFNRTSSKTINFTSFDSRHLRHLHPQIWACPSPNFQGKSGYFSQSGEDKALEKMLFEDTRTKQNPGIFVELGALDGITYSNTLFFERMFDWRGVLIEAQPDNARKLLRANRKNTVKIPFGICSLPQTEIQMLVMFFSDYDTTKINASVFRVKMVQLLVI